MGFPLRVSSRGSFGLSFLLSGCHEVYDLGFGASFKYLGSRVQGLGFPVVPAHWFFIVGFRYGLLKFKTR